jgi:uncharacterized YigZ family protein
MEDSYLTIDYESTGVYREKGSKFLAYAFPCSDMQMFEEKLGSLRKEHPKARHHCYAYIMDPFDKVYRYNDDGEPAGTAGLPIYNQIRSVQLKRIAVIVVRYFGGKKLGASGLINAYKEAAQDAFNGAKIVEKFIEDQFKVVFRFEHTGPVMRALNDEWISVQENGYEETPFIIFSVRQSLTQETINRLFAFLLNRSMEDITGEENIPGFSLEKTGMINA